MDREQNATSHGIGGLQNKGRRVCSLLKLLKLKHANENYVPAFFADWTQTTCPGQTCVFSIMIKIASEAKDGRKYSGEQHKVL